MTEKTYQRLKGLALALTLMWVGWGLLDVIIDRASSQETEFAAARKLLEDGHYQNAFLKYNNLLDKDPASAHALRGKAQSLMHLGKLNQARKIYDKAITLKPDYGVTYANRGILRDRMGDYQGAIDDYQTAIKLEPEVRDGPGWLSRFLRNQSEKPPTVASRAHYLKQQLTLPESDRIFRVQELDNKQRPYSM